MALEAYIHHHLSGRLRLRVPDAKGENDELRDISSAIARTPGISHVEYNPITGSILIQYSPQRYKDLQSLTSSLATSAAPLSFNDLHAGRRDSHRRPHVSGRSVAARRVDSFFKQLDHEIRVATDNEVDLKFILPFGVAVLGLVALRYSSTTPLWLTLLIFAFNSFLGLHAPTPAELGIAGMTEFEG
jgi:Heavy metal associated domain 2